MLRYQTVVDWIELEIQTATPTNAQTVRRSFAFPEGTNPPFVEPLQAGKAGESTRFRFRLQNPTSGRQVLDVVKALAQNLHRNTALISCRVRGIEVAFDTCAPGTSTRQLAEIVADRYRFSTLIPADTWHLYRRRGEHPCVIRNDMHRWELLRHLEDGWQLADTPDKEGAAVRLHGYVKTHDFDGEEFRALPQSERRARFEVTLQGAALPITTLADLEQFDFTALAEYFKFRCLADHLHPAARYTLAHWSTMQLGRRGRYRRRDKRTVGQYSGTSVFRASTVADERLNATAYECLRKLTRNWMGKGASADFTGQPEPDIRVDAENNPAVLTMSLSTTPSIITNNNPLTLNTDNDKEHDKEVAHSAASIRDNINALDVLRTSPLPDAWSEQDAHRAEIDSLMAQGDDDDGP
jgi:hypothetical protein